jgi:hypothetical protein
MTITATREVKVALALEAYGIELRLWKEVGQREWGATLRYDNSVIPCNFEEDNLTLAKLHVLGEARNRAMNRSGSAELPGCDTFLNSWKPIKMPKASVAKKV